MEIEISTIVAIGIAVFSLASLYFLWVYKKKFNSAFLVSFITIISYTLMLEGSLVSIGAAGELVYPTRWIFYGLSCTLLMYEIARSLGKSLSETVFLLYLTAIVMFTGAAASYYDGWYMIGFFAVSTIAYIRLIYPLLTTTSPHRSALAQYILLGWTGFPVVFLLAPDGYGVLTAVTAAVLYLVLDIFTKVLFYIDLRRKMQRAGD
jgi:sensory rhodopsin